MNLILLFCISIIMIVFSSGVKISTNPAQLGSYFAYRTKNSMRSEHTWTDGNNYAGRCLMLSAPFQIILLVASEAYLPTHPNRIFVLLVASIFISVVVTTFLTEKRLSRMYYKDGKRKPSTF